MKHGRFPQVIKDGEIVFNWKIILQATQNPVNKAFVAYVKRVGRMTGVRRRKALSRAALEPKDTPVGEIGQSDTAKRIGELGELCQ